MKHWQICFPERVHQAGKGPPCLGTSAPDFGHSEAASIAILWRTESRAKASTHFARAAAVGRANPSALIARLLQP